MSAPVSSIAQGLQVGVETNEGVAVPANRRFQSTTLALSPNIETNAFRPSGYRVPTQITPGKDFTEGKISGVATFTELVYLLAGSLGYTAPVQIGTSGAYTWSFPLAVSASTAIKTYTVEWGQPGAGGARRCTGVHFPEVALDFSRSAVEVSGTARGQQTVTGQTLTAAPTAIPAVLALPGQFRVYLDDSWAALGSSKMLDVFSASLDIADLFAPWWTLNNAVPSYAARVDSEPKIDVALRLAANATGYAYLDTLRAGGTKFIRIEALGPNIATGTDYTLQVDVAAKYNGAASEDDEDGALVLEPPMTVVADEVSGNALIVTVVNTLPAL